MYPIIAYTVVKAENIEGGLLSGGLDKEVKKLMKEGWEPLGGIAVEKGTFYQAMVKYHRKTEYDQE